MGNSKACVKICFPSTHYKLASMPGITTMGAIMLDLSMTENLEVERNNLVQKAQELTNIFGAILKKSTK